MLIRRHFLIRGEHRAATVYYSELGLVVVSAIGATRV